MNSLIPKILIVDDIPENLIALEQILKPYDYQVIRANSGNEALQHSLVHEFSLVLLDIFMPEMDGYEVAKHLQSTPNTKQTPIIFITANSQEESKIFEAYQTGAIDYLEKPINPTILLSKVKILINLYQAKKEAELASKSKTFFFNQMSHELRTPLNAILGFAQLVLMDEAELSEDHIDSIQEIKNGGEHLLSLVDELLDISKIETGKLEINYQKIDLDHLLQETIKTISPAANKHNITIECLPSNLTVNTDPLRLKQILLNLLDNAVKYNCDNGTIKLFTTQTESQLRLSVSDTGKGMSQEKIDALFEPHKDSENKYTASTGLGLMICKRLVEFMQGKIGVEKNQPQGSVFWVEFSIK